MDPAILRVASIAGAAWLSGLACVFVSFWHLRTLRRRCSPGVEALCDRVRAAGDASFMAAEVRELAAEAERGFVLATLVPRALSRVALTTGTALGVLVLAAGRATLPHYIAGAILAFAGGLAGMFGSALFGQQAKALAITARAEWRAHLREIERRLLPVRSEPGEPF